MRTPCLPPTDSYQGNGDLIPTTARNLSLPKKKRKRLVLEGDYLQVLPEEN